MNLFNVSQRLSVLEFGPTLCSFTYHPSSLLSLWSISMHVLAVFVGLVQLRSSVCPSAALYLVLFDSSQGFAHFRRFPQSARIISWCFQILFKFLHIAILKDSFTIQDIANFCCYVVIYTLSSEYTSIRVVPKMHIYYSTGNCGLCISMSWCSCVCWLVQKYFYPFLKMACWGI